MEHQNIEKRNTKNDTFIQIKKWSLATLRGKPPAEQISITIISKTKYPIPPTLIYTSSTF